MDTDLIKYISNNWLDVLQNITVYIAYFTYFVLLIYTSIIAFIESISAIIYEYDKQKVGYAITAAAMLWSIFIVKGI